jgi:hypothetical protein
MTGPLTARCASPAYYRDGMDAIYGTSRNLDQISRRRLQLL